MTYFVWKSEGGGTDRNWADPLRESAHFGAVRCAIVTGSASGNRIADLAASATLRRVKSFREWRSGQEAL